MRKTTPRDRLLAVAAQLFYRHGVNNVGIDMILARSGVAKMTLYNNYKSKDELVLAFLEKANAEWSAWLKSQVAASRLESRRRPLAVFDALGRWFKTPKFQGCPFINTAAEVRNSRDPIHQAAWAFKKALRDYFRELLAEAGYRRPEERADMFLLLADGAIVRAAMSGEPRAAAAAKKAASVLLRPLKKY